MEKQEVLERLCELCKRVNSRKFHFSVPTCCFCGNPKDESFFFSEEVINFIEDAVDEKLKGAK